MWVGGLAGDGEGGGADVEDEGLADQSADGRG